MVMETQPAIRQNYIKVMLFSRGLAFDTVLYSNAVREQDQDSSVNFEYETAKLTDSLTHFIEVFGSEDSDVKEIMKEYSGPSDAAQKLVRDSVSMLRVANTSDRRAPNMSKRSMTLPNRKDAAMP